jgi:hypothetical protein
VVAVSAAAMRKPDILARIRFWRTVEGGRKGPTPATYLGIPFHFENEFYESWLLLDETGSLYPGDEAIVPLKFLHPPGIVPKLKVGSKFKLWEGKDVADGEVTEILWQGQSKVP